MYEIVLAKFTQNPDLKEKLLATGDEHLEEGNTWGDTTWGTVNGIGENRLGIILMKVRRNCRRNQNEKSSICINSSAYQCIYVNRMC